MIWIQVTAVVISCHEEDLQLLHNYYYRLGRVRKRAHFRVACFPAAFRQGDKSALKFRRGKLAVEREGATKVGEKEEVCKIRRVYLTDRDKKPTRPLFFCLRSTTTYYYLYAQPALTAPKLQ